MSRINWNDAKAGQMILTLEGGKARIMAISGEIFARSSWHNHNEFQEWISFKTAERMGWKIMNPKGPIPTTQEELETMLGYSIQIIPKQKKK